MAFDIFYGQIQCVNFTVLLHEPWLYMYTFATCLTYTLKLSVGIWVWYIKKTIVWVFKQHLNTEKRNSRMFKCWNLNTKKSSHLCKKPLMQHWISFTEDTLLKNEVLCCIVNWVTCIILTCLPRYVHNTHIAIMATVKKKRDTKNTYDDHLTFIPKLSPRIGFCSVSMMLNVQLTMKKAAIRNTTHWIFH